MNVASGFASHDIMSNNLKDMLYLTTASSTINNNTDNTKQWFVSATLGRQNLRQCHAMHTTLPVQKMTVTSTKCELSTVVYCALSLFHFIICLIYAY